MVEGNRCSWWVGRLWSAGLALAAFLVFLAVPPVQAMVPALIPTAGHFPLVAEDGTFRGTDSLSRYDRASLLSQWLYELRASAEALSPGELREMRAELDTYRPELAALGVQVEDVNGPAAGWRIRRAGRSLQDPAFWADASRRSWMMDRMTAVDAFWTDPSSPAMRLSLFAEISDRPMVVPIRPLLADILADWAAPPPNPDFLAHSLRETLRQRIDPPGLAATNIFVPGLMSPSLSVATPALSPTQMTLGELARMSVAAPRAPSVGSLHPTPDSHSSPVLELRLSRAPLAAPTPLFLGRDPWASADLTLFRDLRLSGSYESGALDAANPLPWAAPLPSLQDTEARTSLIGEDLFGAGFSHYSTGLGYQAPRSRFNFNLRLDDYHNAPVLPDTSLKSLGGIDLHLQDAKINVDYTLNPKLTLRGGYIYSRSVGSIASGLSPSLALPQVNLSDERAYPYLGFDYKVSKDTRWNVNIRFYNTPLDFGNGTGRNLNSLHLNNPAVTTEVKVSF